MTDKFTLVVIPESFRRSTADQISGIIFVEVGSLAFPERGWSDLVVAMLGMWSQQLLALLHGEALQVELPFMDGPFVVRLSCRASSSIHVELVERAPAESVDGGFVLPVGDVVAAIVAGIEQTLEACSSRLWWSPDIDALNRDLEELLIFKGV